VRAGRYQAYPEHKDSGVEWLGEIPSHWKTIPVGRLFRRIKRTNHTDKELLSVYRDYGVIPKDSRDDNNNKPSEDLSPYQLVKENDLVMNKMKTWQGSIAISEYEGIVSPAYFVYQPLTSLFMLAQPKYIHYLLRNPMYVAQYLRRSKGIRVNQWDLDPGEFQRIELLLPEKDEQINIFHFLDHETAKIDTLIEKQQQLIKLLKEKRQAVISHAVTKGLNPDAPMRDSGVEWLGEVPTGWNRIPLKLVIRTRKGVAFKSNDFCDQGVRVVKASDIKQLSINTSEVFLPEEFTEEYSKAVLSNGDIILSTVGSNPDVVNSAVGQIGKVPQELNGTLLNQNTVVFDPEETIVLREYIFYVLQMRGYRDHLDLHAHGTANQSSLSIADMLDFKISFPPVTEQIEICDFLNAQEEKLKRLVQRSIESDLLLKERRTALISAVVTGKIDVRNWQAPEQTRTNKEDAA
jgi:type I restriction enzyme, S subunit